MGEVTSSQANQKVGARPYGRNRAAVSCSRLLAVCSPTADIDALSDFQ